MEKHMMKPHIAMVPSPGIGHLIPLIELAKKLVDQADFHVTIIIPTSSPTSKAQNDAVSNLPSSITCVFLPPVSPQDLPDSSRAGKDQNILQSICLASKSSVYLVREAFKSLVESSKVVALIVDLFGTDVFDIAWEFNVPVYSYMTTNASCVALMFHLPTLDEMVPSGREFGDFFEAIEIPGCNVLLRKEDLPNPFHLRTTEAYKLFLLVAKKHCLADGVLVNSFVELEENAIKTFQVAQPGRPMLYPVGPIVQSDIKNDVVDSYGCLRWLEGQPKSSVLYVSFGSGGTLSQDQVNELAHGLELSGERFLWVMRIPDNQSSHASYFIAQSDNSYPLSFLPEGFLERTKGHGLVVPSWAPQIQVLGHGSTGGFLTHCGWNSTLESLLQGLPLIAWPLYAEQKMNAAVLTDDLKVALRPKVGENGLIGREHIAKVVKGLMRGDEGREVRERAERFKEAAAKAVREEGSSTKVLAELTQKWRS